MPPLPPPPPQILVVDDEEDLLDLLAYNLERAGFTVQLARDGVEALAAAEANPPDLIILDIMMPRMDGLETCRRIRQHGRLHQLPIMMLTARDQDRDQVHGLDTGADIYLAKPIAIPVLISQVKALLRGASRYETPPDVLRIGPLEIDRDRYLVALTHDGERQELHFPRKEFALLHFLAANPGRVFTRQELLDEVWGTDVYVVDRTVDVHIRKIREKLDAAYIETVKGIGYRFRD